MKILSYDEVNPQEVLELNIKAFGWFLSPEIKEFIKKIDDRVPKYFALYTVESDAVQSQVGVVTLDTQTTQGIERVGYIWRVATRPKAARKGYAMRLMREAHNRLKEEGIRHSFLGTGKSRIAYYLYKKHGYKDFTMLKRGLLDCGNIKNREITLDTEAKGDTVYDIFSEFSRNCLGFVKRSRNFLEVRSAWTWFHYDIIGVFYRDEKPLGFHDCRQGR